ncbi:Hypp9113 [Branchiostoma lanceolatum]|uniref:Hypp9113 protein n=1 Tax=Branchiostoma lanceolatum TaxID=7740 RepID=A0A8K0EFZ2_BRALA|nr:Hypp9113 [Branchiostoma lanceolatum]
MNRPARILVLIVLFGTSLQARVQKDVAQLGALEVPPVEADNNSSRPEDTNATVPFSLDYMSQQLLEQQAMIHQLQTEMTAKDQEIENEMQQLQAEIAAKDQTIQALQQQTQALEQRPYIERCESGVVGIPAYALSSGSGTRYRDLTATFRARFRKTPVVTIGLKTLDSSSYTRLDASVRYVYASHMTVRISTWSSSGLHSASVYWMACA